MTFALFMVGGDATEETPRATDTEGGRAVYPEGPYGSSAGLHLAPTLSFEIVGPGRSLARLSMRDLHDPDGRRGNRALLVVESAAWSPVCQSQAMHLRSVYRERIRPRGIVILQLLFEDEARRPARFDAALLWTARYEATWLCGVDPLRKLPGKTVPTSYLVDPRTMRITHVFEGWDESAARLADDLAHRNRD